MLKRQKVLLSLIRESGGSVGRIELFKYAFLLGKGNNIPSDFSFYDFVPYQYGPYSFSMAQELEALEKYGFISSGPDYFSLATGMEVEVESAVRQLPLAASRPVQALLQQYRGLTRQGLLREVYNSFPRYTVNSKLRALIPEGVERSRTAPIAVYTVGYQNKSIDRFLHALIEDGIAAIADVRANPVSMKYGFAKRTFSSLAGKMGIAYSHFPELGIPSSNRKKAQANDSFAQLFADYEHNLQAALRSEISRLLAAIKSRPTVLVCMENDQQCCHRSRLAKVLASASGLEIVHL